MLEMWHYFFFFLSLLLLLCALFSFCFWKEFWVIKIHIQLSKNNKIKSFLFKNYIINLSRISEFKWTNFPPRYAMGGGETKKIPPWQKRRKRKRKRKCPFDISFPNFSFELILQSKGPLHRYVPTSNGHEKKKKIKSQSFSFN